MTINDLRGHFKKKVERYKNSNSTKIVGNEANNETKQNSENQ